MVKLDFQKIDDDKKLVFLLGLSEKAINIFSEEKDRKIAKNALDLCWKWLQNKELAGEYFYELLYDEYEGMTIIPELSENEQDEITWNCIIDTVAYTSRKAYENEGAEYFPESIELVDDTLFDHFVKCFNSCVPNSENYIQKIYDFLNNSKFESNGIKREDVLMSIIK